MGAFIIIYVAYIYLFVYYVYEIFIYSYISYISIRVDRHPDFQNNAFANFYLQARSLCWPIKPVHLYKLPDSWILTCSHCVCIFPHSSVLTVSVCLSLSLSLLPAFLPPPPLQFWQMNSRNRPNCALYSYRAPGRARARNSRANVRDAPRVVPAPPLFPSFCQRAARTLFLRHEP